MEIVAWLLAIPVLAIAAVVTAAVVLAGIYGLAVAAAAAGLVFTYRTAGTGGLVVVGGCVLVPLIGALVTHRMRSRREAGREAADAHPTSTASTDTTKIPAPRPPVPSLPGPPPPKGRCPVCGRAVVLTPARGRIKTHVTRGERCPGMGSVPASA